MFADAAGKMGATRHFSHEPGAKCFIDWAGDVAHLTDKLLGTRTKVYVLVVTLPFSDKFWAEGFCDMRQKSWQEGQIHAFEEFGGVVGHPHARNAGCPTTPPRRPIGPQPRGSRS